MTDSKTTKCFSGNNRMTDSKTTKCFSGIVRRLLCTGSLPTHPSDHITESNTTHALTQLNKTEFDHQPKQSPKTPAKVENSATNPGLVARLMGLESLPISRTLDSIARSRSVNSIDYFIAFDPLRAHHRRIRTTSSVSFRELPTFLHQQNQDLLVFYLENVDETKEMGLKQRKTEMGFGELKQKKVERSKINKENMMREKVHVVKKKENVENKKKASKAKEEPRMSVYRKRGTSKVGTSSGANDVVFVLPHKNDVYRKPRATLKAKNPLKPVNQKEVSVGSKFINKRKSQQGVKKELECNSENSSPVSGTLDLQNFSIHPNSSLSGDSRPMVLNSRRKSSARINNANYDYPSPHIARKTSTDGLEVGAIIKNKDCESVKSRESEYYIKALGEICKLTEKDMKESNWVAKEVCSKAEDFEEICMDFGQHILDIQLHQVVDELVAYHITNF